MNFWISASTDIGNTKGTNQDSLYVKIMQAKEEQLAFAILCDGMGGLEKGELASASVVQAYKKWSEERLPLLYAGGFLDKEVEEEWRDIAIRCNEHIKSYGSKMGLELGTTATIILIVGQQYYIMNVGDTRAYEIFDCCNVLTKDQTVVAREVEMGTMLLDQAEHDPRRSVLLQCIGASDELIPDMFLGTARKDAVYMLCSDGFRHEISQKEIYAYFKPDGMTGNHAMKRKEEELIRLNKKRRERDNISVITIRTY